MENSLKNVESDNNKILYKTLLDFFYSKTVLTFRISLIILQICSLCYVNLCNKLLDYNIKNALFYGHGYYSIRIVVVLFHYDLSVFPEAG